MIFYLFFIIKYRKINLPLAKYNLLVIFLLNKKYIIFDILFLKNHEKFLIFTEKPKKKAQKHEKYQ